MLLTRPGLAVWCSLVCWILMVISPRHGQQSFVYISPCRSPLPRRLFLISLTPFIRRPFVKRFALCYRTVVLSALSVTLVYCGQTVEWIKMKLGMKVRPGHNVLDRDPAPPKGAHPPIFGACSLWSNGGMNQDTTWYAGRPRPRRLCVRWEPSSPQRKGAQHPPIFGPCLLWPNGWMDQDATFCGGRLRSRPHCVRYAPSSPSERAQHPSFWPMSIVTKWSPISATAEYLCLFTRCRRLSNRLSKRFDNRLYRVNGVLQLVAVTCLRIPCGDENYKRFKN